MEECNKIIELYNGHFQLILNISDKFELYKIIDQNYKYVWLIEHIEDSVEWAEYHHSLYGVFDKNVKIQARNIQLNLLLKTEDFIKYIPYINQTIKIIQTNTEPPYYLNMEQLHGKARFDLLKIKIDYLFEIEMPGASDFSVIVSPQKEYLESLLKIFSADSPLACRSL